MIGNKSILTSEDTLFFLHIPKCAGTTLINILEQRYTSNAIYKNHYYVKLMESLDNQEFNRYKFIRGHYPYDRIIDKFDSPPKIITFLREPITRFISNYEMRQRTFDPGQDPEHQKKVINTLNSIDFDESLETDWLVDLFANRMTRFIGGRIKQDNGKIVPNIEVAKERLVTKFSFLGITEKFSESVNLMAWVFGFSPIEEYSNLNVSPNREKRREIPEKLINRSRELNWADVELYDFALELYEEQKQNIQKQSEKEKPSRVIELQTSITDNFEFVDPGQGWYVGQVDKKYGPTRWSGPNNTSCLFYPLSNKNDMQINLYLVPTRKNSNVDKIQLFVNGNEIRLSQKKIKDISKKDILLTGKISKTMIGKSNGGKSELEFTVDSTNRLKFGDHFDPVDVGFCIYKLEIHPLD